MGSEKKMIMVKQMATVNGISELTELVVMEDLESLCAAVGLVGDVVKDN
jgi:hypothetical protein